MTIDVNTLIQPGASDQYLAKMLAVAGALKLPTTSWQEGDPSLTILEILADVQAGRDANVETPIVKGLLLDFAADPSVTPEPVRGVIYQGGWLDLAADQLYDTQRSPASCATVELMFVNATGGVITYPAGSYHVQDATAASTYSNPVDLTIPTGTSGPYLAQANTVGAGQIAPTVTTTPVVNLTMSILLGSFSDGTDTESNAALVTRARGKFQTFSLGGPPGAYDTISKSIPVETPPRVASGLRTTPNKPVTRTMTVAATGGPLSTPDVTLYVANASGEYDPAEQYTDSASIVVDAAVPNLLGFVSILTHVAHHYSDNDNVYFSNIAGIVGVNNTASNPTWPVNVTGSNGFTIPVSATGTYTGGGTCYRVSDLDLIKKNLAHYVQPDGILLSVIPAVEDDMSIVWGIEIRAAGATQALVDAINSALRAYVSAIPIGGIPILAGGNGVPASAIIGTIWGKDPINIMSVYIRLGGGAINADWSIAGASSVVTLTTLAPTLITDAAHVVIA